MTMPWSDEDHEMQLKALKKSYVDFALRGLAGFFCQIEFGHFSHLLLIIVEYDIVKRAECTSDIQATGVLGQFSPNSLLQTIRRQIWSETDRYPRSP